MMTPLASRVHGAAVGSDLVFLDVARDAYVCLAGAAQAGRLCDEGAQIETDDGELIAALHEAGLTGAIAVPRPMAPRANRSLRRHSRPVAALDILAGVPMSWGLSVARRYHGPFDQLIRWPSAGRWGRRTGTLSRVSAPWRWCTASNAAGPGRLAEGIACIAPCCC